MGGGSSSTSGDQQAAGVPCPTTLCNAPMSCCEAPDAGAVPSCVLACVGDQLQRCVNDADCQSSGTAMCVNKICTDTGSSGDAGYIAPLDGGVAPPPTDAGTVAAGYPTPTTANRALCKTVPISTSLTTAAPPACAGAPAGNVCIECLFGGTDFNASDTPPPAADATSEAGNYAVTVQLGGTAAGQTVISTESSRGMLASVSTTAGQSVEYSFMINVRGMEGQPNHAGGPGGYPGLDLFFTGPAATPPQVTAIGYALASATTPAIQLFVASDSTACDQSGGAYGGWGQMLPEYFQAPIAVANYANSGASSLLVLR